MKSNKIIWLLRRASALLAILLVLTIGQPAYGVSLNDDYPRLANYFLKWGISDAETIELAKWDVVILDMEAQTYSPDNLRKLRQLNPNIKIVAYITSQEIRSDARTLDPKTLRYQLASQIQDSWYLKDVSGQKVNWWPGTNLLNVTELSPTSNGQQWNDFLPEFVNSHIMSTGLWDGVFYDNAWGGVSWFSSKLDLNGDHVADTGASLDARWQEGMRRIINHTRELIGPNKLILANDGIAYYSLINGSLFEDFPQRTGWSQGMRNYFLIEQRGAPPSAGILNGNTANTGQQDFRAVRYGLVSTLLNNGYYSYDFGDQNHGQLWWFDEYSTFLGAAKGNATNLLNPASTVLADSVWRRDFEKGTVILNATDQPRTVDLNGEFEKIHGIQDPLTNDGLITDTVTLQPRDGLVLLRPLETLNNAVYTNGSFVRVFDRAGNVKRTGFFAYENQYRGSASIYTDDLSGNGQPETLVADNGALSFYNVAGSLIRTIYPYGQGYKGKINVAVGDLDGDGFKEIVTGAGPGGGPHVRIFNKDGGLINPGFFPYPTTFHGGVNVAIGDLNGDGRSEIITAPGSGYLPQVKVFDQHGVLVKVTAAQANNFLAYASGFRGGVSVSAGDYNGDGKAEIITGQQTGGVQVKVFDQLGHLKYAPFDAFKTNKTQGVNVIALDLDGDRATEILATSTKSFTVSTAGANIK